ncbi:hypothetical protein LTR10_000464 [Elasticomyces elasticus]|nr:hypothetical protein LTR10_000464 [Elasticomyces elasticus]KAK4980286.1 hypothetical protein LTR42_000593 [Elasticomyces elasticus]
MMKRWRRICYGHAHAKRLGYKVQSTKPKPAVDLNKQENEQGRVDLELMASMSQAAEDRRPRQKYSDSALPSQSAATTYPADIPLLRPEAMRATSSKATSRVDNIDIDLPSIPQLQAVDTGYVYRCPFCGVAQQISKRLTKQTWKLHLWSDLTPYTCLYDTCTLEEVEFASVHDWREHMVVAHGRPTWRCMFCERPGAGHMAPEDRQVDHESGQKLAEHCRQCHPGEVKEDDIMALVRYSRGGTLDACLICDSSIGIPSRAGKTTVSAAERQEDIMNCMATHLESISLSCIPWQLGSRENARSSQAQGTQEDWLQGAAETAAGVFEGSKQSDSHSTQLRELESFVASMPIETAEQTTRAWASGVAHADEETVKSPEAEAEMHPIVTSPPFDPLRSSMNSSQCQICRRWFVHEIDLAVHMGSHERPAIDFPIPLMNDDRPPAPRTVHPSDEIFGLPARDEQDIYHDLPPLHPEDYDGNPRPGPVSPSYSDGIQAPTAIRPTYLPDPRPDERLGTINRLRKWFSGKKIDEAGD